MNGNWFFEFLEFMFRNGWTFLGCFAIFAIIISFLSDIISSINSTICKVKTKKYEYKSIKLLTEKISSREANDLLNDISNVTTSKENNYADKSNS